jgi:hypothetical protein
MATPAVDAVARLLRDQATRAATLDALERHEGGIIGRAVSLAAAPALYELLAADASDVGRDVFDRVGLLLARLVLIAEAPSDAAAVYGAAIGEGRWAAFLRSEGSVLGRAWRTPAAELTRADARSWACSSALLSPAWAHGGTKAVAAAGFSTSAEWFRLYMSETPVISK